MTHRTERRAGHRPALVFLLALLVLPGAPAPVPASTPEEHEVDLRMGVRIPTRDGVELAATLYLPRDVDHPVPAVFSLTPYSADRFHERGMAFARSGYVVALVDVRGRGSSGGSFVPFAHDAEDGHDVTEWLAAQPFCNGKVSMWGGSYGGFVQWQIASTRPPHLASIVPVASPHLGVDFPFFNNVFFTYAVQWLTFTSGQRADTNLFADFSYWLGKYHQLHEEGRAFAELDRLVGNETTAFRTWIEHPTPDAYWDAMAPAAEDYARLHLPVLTLTGTYDGDLRGALHYYRRHHENGDPDALADHYLVLGPWDHAGTRTPRREVGGLTFGPASMIDMDELHRQWYDWTLRGGEKPELLRDRVAYYVAGQGAEEWRWAPSLGAIPTRPVGYHLGSDGSAGDLFHSGTLTREPRPAAESTSWRHDPRDRDKAGLSPRVFHGLAGESFDRDVLLRYVRDQRMPLALDGDGVAFHTPPFEEPIEIVGEPRLDATLEIDVPDADLDVRLYEILADGSSIALSDDLLRLRYRNSLRRPEPVTVGEPFAVSFDSFQLVSRRIARGSRLRLVITSPDPIYLERNYNAGGEVARETAADARPATIRLHHSEERPAVLTLPVVRVAPDA